MLTNHTLYRILDCAQFWVFVSFTQGALVFLAWRTYRDGSTRQNADSTFSLRTALGVPLVEGIKIETSVAVAIDVEDIGLDKLDNESEKPKQLSVPYVVHFGDRQKSSELL